MTVSIIRIGRHAFAVSSADARTFMALMERAVQVRPEVDGDFAKRDQLETDAPEVKGWLTPARVNHQLITLQSPRSSWPLVWLGVAVALICEAALALQGNL